MAHWPERRFSYDSDGNIDYMGLADRVGKSTSETGWFIFKYTSGSDGITRIQGPLSGSWENKTNLSW